MSLYAKLFMPVLLAIVALGFVPAVNAQQGGPQYGSDRGNLEWRGRVNGVVELIIHGRSLKPVVRSGRGLNDVSYDFDGYLPKRNETVRITSQSGRGTVHIIKQPKAANNYTAVVRIEDHSGGREFSQFRLEW